MATHHDRVTTDPSGGSNTTFGDEREYNASRQTGSGTGTGYGDDSSYGSSRTAGVTGTGTGTSTGYGDDTSYGSSRTTGATGYGDDQSYGSSRTTGATGTGYGDDSTYGSSRTAGATGTGTGTGYGDNDTSYGSSRTTGADSSTYGTSSTSTTGHGNFRSDAADRDGHTLQAEYPAREEIPDRQGSLASTAGPFQVPTTDNPQGTSAAVTSSVGSENAPGKAGEIGEKVMGAFGVGGTHVERPKEEQGLGEKIVNLLGI